MKNKIAVGMAVVGLMFATVGVAHAGPPEILDEGTETVEITFPFEVTDDDGNVIFVDPGPCGPGVTLVETVKVRESRFYNRDGSFKKDTIHVNGTSVWTGPGGSATEHWAWNGTRTEEFDEDTELLTMTFTEAGNFWNVHQPGEGVVLHEKGRRLRTLTFAAPDSPPVDETFTVVGGPDDFNQDGLAALCEANRSRYGLTQSPADIDTAERRCARAKQAAPRAAETRLALGKLR